ncbi:MAG TPA: hypothetical protein VMT89_19245 [Candidatus Acidoferrales bacterium]|nr:hypothetical protein [Candidatus Acidoferrales bacterium]
MKKMIPLLTMLALLSVRAFAEDAKSAWPAFCEEWMHKLQAREERNVSLIKWEDDQSNSVLGSYIGYSHQHECILKNDDGPSPVGKITYLEVRYEKRGANKEEAASSPAKAIETTEVTEIFRFSKGAWVY